MILISGIFTIPVHDNDRRYPTPRNAKTKLTRAHMRTLVTDRLNGSISLKPGGQQPINYKSKPYSSDTVRSMTEIDC